ncbi:glycoside hydrolase family 3 N-terminal domain-containing protein [Knoellia aerolata]|uniref:beta-N-acetylhexosaminidase n=1 Tax=Knoellia aerolata DSM 18566 TaxID=1385519 RepID=A0A0A0JQS2_9MICO|nr:glycoside hydrolase family 3 N-terminal domain-containing protein [Knoellia aerolata]KGN38397.1 B-hexosaminidase [Knoellia aerolata DSM 18566]
MTSRSTSSSFPRLTAAVAASLVGLLATGCGGGEADDRSTGAASGSATGTAAGSATRTTPPTTGGSVAPSPSGSAGGPVTAGDCAREKAAGLTEEQSLGQLMMVAFDTAAPRTALDGLIAERHVGNVIYLGGWDGAARVKEASTHLQEQATDTATAGIPLLLAADQEGGEVRQLRGAGFTAPPSAKVQAQMSSPELTAAATTWARELRAVGVNVNLAPVTDTVPAEIGRANEPIGKFGRQYGSDPGTVTKASTAFLRGMIDGGVMGTVKHFPGLGRVERNTDFNTTGITDTVATKDDPFLAPFAAGVKAGAGLVMVSSARYPGLDPTKTQAMFSKPIISGLLRGQMGYDGVVVTDDVNAKAVRSIPAAQRAVDYVEAGGDILLTGDPESVGPMVDALAARALADEDFATLVDTSVLRVLALKERMGLLRCP